MAAADMERDPSVQHVDVRLFFPAEMAVPDVLDKISEALQCAPELCDLISAYELAEGTPYASPLA